MMTTTVPQALSIAGFDGGGGAGLQADLKTFQERYVFGTTILTALPIQNTQGVSNVFEIPLTAIEEQFESIEADFAIAAVKTGMLFTTEIIDLVVSFLAKGTFGPLVVDPVMVAKSGHHLLKEAAVQRLKNKLIPLATVITPNIPEAECLIGKQIHTKAQMIEAAKNIQQLGVKNVVVKGGHHLEGKHSTDILLLENGTIHELSEKRIATKNTHGTGCTFSACITAELAKGRTVLEAVVTAKAFIQAAIADGIQVGHGNGPTNHWAFRKVEICEKK
jgi:hydroxymethylpyrimidine/phosphomethylpyrimidine kinase